MKLQDLKQYGVTRAPVRTAVPKDRSLPDLLSGEVVPIGNGQSFYREETYHATHFHGLHGPIQVRDLSGQRLGVVSKDPELSYVDLRNAVFLDTETTGLWMGSGTYVFLVGAGYLDRDTFRVRQYFLGGPQEEPAYLQAIDEFLRRFSALVTFNGKAFDWPLLEGRFARLRRRMPLQDPPHVDLLHPARRVWKRRLESCALSALERDVLGVSRTWEDVPGWEIPQRYFMYLRASEALGLEGVFYHNVQDILSLATLAVRLDLIVLDPLSGHLEYAADYLSVGKVFERAGDDYQASACYEEALRRPCDPEDRREALLRLGAVHKRLRMWDAALLVWERMVDEGGESALIALIEMAKFYEHVERDYSSALDVVRNALMLLELRGDVVGEALGAELTHRQGRLLNRVASGRGRSWSRVG